MTGEGALAWAPCPTCAGMGWIFGPDGYDTDCPRCGGEGEIVRPATTERKS